MINLTRYREYWQTVVDRVHGLTALLPVTIDNGMGKRIQSLKTDSVTLFLFPPIANSQGRADAVKERNKCVVFVMEKYDPQRRSSFDVLESTQNAVEELKWLVINDMSHGCSPFHIVYSSIETAPETELYGTFAGWSIAFEIISD